MNIKVDCIKRLLDVNCASSMIDFMIKERIVNKELYIDALNDQVIAEITYLALTRALSEERIMLADFEWSILPKELIKITIVTPEIHEEFTYGL